MQHRFSKHIQENFPSLTSQEVVLAISGGVDSVVLAHLLQLSQVDFALAHVNFRLRGKESDADEVFVKELAQQLGCPFYVQHFDTKKFAEDHGVSIQMAARDLRYAWFEELCAQENYKSLLTAHHANDSLETFFINLMRGTGLTGLTGIPENNQLVVRPLLIFSREEIEAFAKENDISWREDASNQSNAYLRNKIRNQVYPILKEENPDVISSFLKTQAHLQESEALLEDYTALLFSKIVKETSWGYELAIQELKKIPNSKAVLYQLLKDFGFTEWEDVYLLLEAQSGKRVFSKTHQLLKDREVLILEKIKKEEEGSFKVNAKEDLIFSLGILKQEKVEKIEEKTKNTAYFPIELLKFPLELRKWKPGDYFYPFGMQGKKKISDFLIDEKIPVTEKEKIWVLCNETDIIWIVNHRTDERYKIQPTQNILKFNLIP
ncbi:tRNA lysidine(34) synthetase TilS [Mesonia sp. MT50]|uniref:tRNA(Ile)-lysidine synthase n=1 Tax=Mesonia profundi TaxID=3070998 RepID=A0ABU1A298_9FLAO|nr:tRNA lysidine(34) synthetase TilS [Mesonia profundi]MDQ7917820.1 tRNA lysidine(34) synthetase TilS [Mesonia profundi]